MPAQKQIDVVVEKVLYPKSGQDDKGWYVLATDQGRASGKMAWMPIEGERLRLTGEEAYYGGKPNFNFVTAIPNVPVDPRDMLRYVCERAKGIGPAIEDALWEAMGKDWKNAKPGCVKGFSPAKANAFHEALALTEVEADKSQVIGWLMGRGATVNMATAAFEVWKKNTVGVIQNNPFRLADLPNYSFADVDGAIRKNFDIGDEDPRRIKAAVVYKLRQMTAGGSTVIDWPALRDASGALIGSWRLEAISEMVSEMFQDGSLKGFPGTQRIALATDYKNEVAIFEYVMGKSE
jgi:hypothetical protein